MAVARPLLRQRISPLPFLTSQPVVPTPSNSRTSFFSSSTKLHAPSTNRRIPENCKIFFKSDGTLFTTQANQDFLRDYNVTHDNGILYGTPRPIGFDQKVFRQFGVTVNFTTHHVISLFHLAWLDPRGHPSAAYQRERYMQMALNEPLWVFTTTVGGFKAVVRSTAMRRIRAAVYLGLQARGYDKYGRGKNGDLVGTLALGIQEPLKTVSAENMQEFGEKIVQYMEATKLMPSTTSRSSEQAWKSTDRNNFQNRGRKQDRKY